MTYSRVMHCCSTNALVHVSSHLYDRLSKVTKTVLKMEHFEPTAVSLGVFASTRKTFSEDLLQYSAWPVAANYLKSEETTDIS